MMISDSGLLFWATLYIWASNDTCDGKLMCRKKLQVGRLGAKHPSGRQLPPPLVPM